MRPPLSAIRSAYKDTSSVALNPIIKFTTLFGLLAVEMAVAAPRCVSVGLGVAFFLIGLYFVYRSFYGMRIEPKKVDWVLYARPLKKRAAENSKGLIPDGFSALFFTLSEEKTVVDRDGQKTYGDGSKFYVYANVFLYKICIFLCLTKFFGLWISCKKHGWIYST